MDANCLQMLASLAAALLSAMASTAFQIPSVRTPLPTASQPLEDCLAPSLREALPVRVISRNETPSLDEDKPVICIRNLEPAVTEICACATSLLISCLTSSMSFLNLIFLTHLSMLTARS